MHDSSGLSPTEVFDDAEQYVAHASRPPAAPVRAPTNEQISPTESFEALPETQTTKRKVSLDAAVPAGGHQLDPNEDPSSYYFCQGYADMMVRKRARLAEQHKVKVHLVPAAAVLEPVSPAPACPPEPFRRTLRVLYIFAGPERYCDVRHWLQLDSRVQAVITEIDILRDAKLHDVTRAEVWDGIVRDLRALMYDILAMTPPCCSFTRSVWNDNGPPNPVRSRDYPYGFPWLARPAKDKADLGNLFIKLTIQGAAIAIELSLGFLCEHPEDLGRTSDGGTPASMWQWPEVLAFSSMSWSVALYQCKFEAPYPKPTRLWGTLLGLKDAEFCSWPRFSATGGNLGPLL